MTYVERAVDFEPLPEEERASKESDGKTLEGYAAVFDADTEINSWEGHFKERIARGAFRKTLKERQPVLQFDHGHDTRFGSLPIGAFESVKEDRHGLRVQARLFEHAEPIREAIAAQAVKGMSFRMKVVRDTWADNKGVEIKDRSELLDLLYGGADAKKRGPLQRTIKEVKLMEAGPVVFPAYTQTSVGMRSAEDMSKADREALYALAYEGEGERSDDVEALISEGFTPESVAEAIAADDMDLLRQATETTPEEREDAPEGDGEPEGSVAPVVGAEDPEAREEDPDDAAQAGTSTGMTSNARERALRLLDLI